MTQPDNDKLRLALAAADTVLAPVRAALNMDAEQFSEWALDFLSGIKAHVTVDVQVGPKVIVHVTADRGADKEALP